MELTWIVKNCALNSDKKVMEVSLVFINSVPVLSAGMKQPVGGVLGSIFAGSVCCWPHRTPTCVDLLIFKSSLTRIFVGSFLMDNAKRGMNL